MNNDNLAWKERVKAWQIDPANKSKSVKGDDRSPAWTWIGCLYKANDLIVVESDAIMAMLRDAGQKCPTGKGRASYKAITQSGILVDQIGWPVETSKGFIKWSSFDALHDDEDFTVHEKVANQHGIDLFVKRVTIGNSKWVRVRPRFDQWKIEGTITVVDDTLTTDVLQTIFNVGGHRCGLCDWRPGSPKKPGSFGMFETTLKEIKMEGVAA